MGIEYLWDTNTAIYFLQQQFPSHAEKFIDQILLNGANPCISVITEIELLCWKGGTQKDVELLHIFIENATIIELDAAIKINTAEIRKTLNLKLPDAIIAASAKVYNLILITRNIKDFKKVNELSVVNPWDE